MRRQNAPTMERSRGAGEGNHGPFDIAMVLTLTYSDSLQAETSSR
jgi:hypothetical protein